MKEAIFEAEHRGGADNRRFRVDAAYNFFTSCLVIGQNELLQSAIRSRSF